MILILAWYNKKAVSFIFSRFKKKWVNTTQDNYHTYSLVKSDFNIDITLYHQVGDKAVSGWIEGRKSFGNIINRLYEMYLRVDRTFVISRTLTYFASLFPYTFKQSLWDLMWPILLRRSPYRYIPVTIPRHFFENLSTIDFYGMAFNSPSNVEKYLKYRYGRNWKIPTKNWTYQKDDGSVNPNYLINHFLLRIE